MSTNVFDPTKYKAAQRAEWDEAATGWRKWWETIERGAQPVSDRLVELAGIYMMPRQDNVLKYIQMMKIKNHHVNPVKNLYGPEKISEKQCD